MDTLGDADICDCRGPELHRWATVLKGVPLHPPGSGPKYCIYSTIFTLREFLVCKIYVDCKHNIDGLDDSKKRSRGLFPWVSLWWIHSPCHLLGALTVLMGRPLCNSFIHTAYMNVIYKTIMYSHCLFYSSVIDMKFISTLLMYWMVFSEYKANGIGVFTIFNGITKEMYCCANFKLNQLNSNYSLTFNNKNCVISKIFVI